MVNAQEWLNSKFPTEESKQAVIGLEDYNYSGTEVIRIGSWREHSGTIAKFYVVLEGDLDLAGFSNLAYLTFSKQSSLKWINLSSCLKLVNLNLIECPQAKPWGLIAENKVKELAEKEVEYKRQIREKEESIQSKQTEINRLKDSDKDQSKKIENLEKQVRDLTAEKNALQERMLRERQEALREWEKEKNELTSNLKKLEESKDTFQKSADYLRETLKTTEKNLEEIKAELKASQEELTAEKKEKETAQESFQEELKKRGEAYQVISERNQELEKKLQASQLEVSKLSEWIGKLEAVSGDGNAFSQLKKELEGARGTIASLEEQLQAKKGKSYWWVYLVIGLGAVWLAMG